jgi:hypothetical protein
MGDHEPELGVDYDVIGTIFQSIVTTHGPSRCEGEFCCVHKPSPHHMIDWPLVFRLDRADCLAERICEHGLGHPDPDSVAFIHRQLIAAGYGESMMIAVMLHSCDGCCGIPPTEAPLEIP